MKTRRVIKRLVIAGLGTVAVLLVLAAGLMALFLSAPQVFLNDKTLALSQPLIQRLGYEASWRDGGLKAESLSFWHKRIAVSFSDFSYQSPSLRAAIARLNAEVTLSFWPRETFLTGIGPIMLTGARTTVDTTVASPTEDDEPLNLNAILQFFEDRHVESTSVSVDNWKLIRKDETISGDLQFVLARPEQHHYTLSLKSNLAKGAPIRLLDLKGELTVSGEQDKQQLGGLADFTVLLASGGRASGNLEIIPRPESRSSSFAANARLTAPGNRLFLSTKGELNRTTISGQMEFDAGQIGGKPLALALAPCSYQATSEDFLSKDAKLQLDCKGRIKRPSFAFESQLPSSLLPRTFGFAWSLAFNLNHEDEERIAEFTTRLAINDVKQPPLYANGIMEAEGLIPLSNVTSPRRLTASFDTNVSIMDVSTIVKRLEGSRYPIPAPLNQLAGPLGCKAKGIVDLVAGESQIPLSCHTDLRSAQQSIVSETNAKIGLTRVNGLLQPHIDARLMLSDIQLILPDINPREPLPRLVTDKRIVDEVEQQAKRTLPAVYRVQVQTLRPDSIRIQSNLARTPIPIAVDILKTNDPGLDGQLTIGQFTVSALRREAHVQKITLAFEPGQSAAELNGLVTFPNNDYKVSLDIVGTTESPAFTVYTDPPLPENQAFAVLIFGQAPESLGDDEVRSSEEARAAMADNAISLASMYYLAATPVESVGYNPYTKQFTARVTLAEGLSLTVGSDTEDLSTVGLRKRIGNNWSIETTVSESVIDSGNRGTAKLKWGKRY